MLTLFGLLIGALPWMDLSEGDSLNLNQKIVWSELGPAFPMGTSVKLLSKEALSIPGAPMLLLNFEQFPCIHPEWEGGMQIIVPEGSSEASSVGLELEQDCQWKVYVEQKDLFTNSFFIKNSFWQKNKNGAE
jgi:hypothetical protein